jgi:leucyl aminopeptidase
MDRKTFEDFGLVETAAPNRTIELIPLSPKTLGHFTAKLHARERNLLLGDEFHASLNDQSYIPNSSGQRYVRAYVGVDDIYPNEGGVDVTTLYDDKFLLAPWATSLNAGIYGLSDKLNLTAKQKHGLALGFGLASYQFTKHKTIKPPPRKAFLKIPRCVDAKRLMRELETTAWVQDMINEPPNILDCEGLTQEAIALAKIYGASISVIKGNDLKEDKKNFPLVYAVGKASAEQPRVVDMHWGDPSNPRVTLVGKGVVFDTGGIDIKDTESMDNMKFDMAGAAHALGAARMVMDAGLPVRLRVLLPIVENSIGPKSYKPGEVYKMRMGRTIEVINSDAEGRIILADVLYEASHPTLNKGEKRPKLICDFATTGWHGHTEFPGFGTIISNRDHVADEFKRAAAHCQEYMTVRPLLRRLEKELMGIEGEDAVVADYRQCVNDHGRYDDLLVGGLLWPNIRNQPGERCQEPDWTHSDIQPWRYARSATTPYPPGLPVGGFAQGVRSAYYMIEKRYGAGP